MGDGQNYGPFLGPYYIRHLIFRVPKKGPLILTTTHMVSALLGLAGIPKSLHGLEFRVVGLGFP